VVATRQNQTEALEELQQNALRNGVVDIQLLSAAEARRTEPELHCVAVLNSPSTGIVDSHGLMTAMLGDFEAAGGVVAFRLPVKRQSRTMGRLRFSSTMWNNPRTKPPI